METLNLVVKGLALLTAFYGLYICGNTTIKVNKTNKNLEEKVHKSLNSFYLSHDSPLKKQIDKVLDENPEFRDDLQARIQAFK